MYVRSDVGMLGFDDWVLVFHFFMILCWVESLFSDLGLFCLSYISIGLDYLKGEEEKCVSFSVNYGSNDTC